MRLSKATAANPRTRTTPSKKSQSPAKHPEDCVLVLQGGGALGAYQAGVFETLSKFYREPTWVAGISIGAINAAIIAGNPVADRVSKLREFWDLVSSSPLMSPFGGDTQHGREHLNEASATQALVFGIPGFFRPRFPPAPLQPRGTLAAISYYDTAPLKATLERLVDFDLINHGKTRLSVGAVNVRSGNFAYFDSAHQKIDVRHIMASGALPPGFAPVEIDGEHYWDGGLVSNTPLQYVLDTPVHRRQSVFQVDLFAATGVMPETLAEVTEREKDIRFSSRTRLNTSNEIHRQALALAAQRLVEKLPAKFKFDPDVMALMGPHFDHSVDVVHLIYRSKRYETQSKDYEFSRPSMREHWDAGITDMATSLNHERWTRRDMGNVGVRVFDLAFCRSPASPPG